ncbi:prepilin-type N-terminal cleavage/methylation domain-containing protein [Rheinheimera sediminis]|uniref:type IV pilus modification PilV family protein n=1 Tax=Rheinheimera sp. YQF-1 TaxID=2499626 RepID=UPI000FD8799E|nr:prepilin-type N-terminal cleavage/methylation domain-containing protein [Rheinheimera sp. YQF-1]RVT45975.1 prepilin-type N-terminal cleavage/methylation domain-containing protein [Rheinheimera sp. YQF-1]
MQLKPFPVPKGFTLVEIILGIVVLAIALLVITASLGPLYKQSADPWHRVRAAELGHSFLNEILARSFDEYSDRAGGYYRCDAGAELGSVPCTTPVLSADSLVFPPDCSGSSCEERLSFDDVDDFNGFSSNGVAIANIISESLASSYLNYGVAVRVGYDGDRDGIMNNQNCTLAPDPYQFCLERQLKLIVVSITTPSGETIDFSAYRGNW